MSHQAAKVLRDAARLIRERGWSRGVSEDETGAVCALRALNLAAPESAQVYEFAAACDAVRELALAINRATGCDTAPSSLADSCERVVVYNDHTAASRERLLDRFEDAAAHAEAQSRE